MKLYLAPLEEIIFIERLFMNVSEVLINISFLLSEQNRT